VKRLAALVIAVLAATTAASAMAADPAAPLLQRLFAPCCYRETLDMHSSPVADDLRAEIRERVHEGESADAILADMVKRYGTQILTRPPGEGLAVALFAGAGGLAAAFIVFATRRARRGAPREDDRTGREAGPQDLELTDRLDDEIAALE
jgi:cytochrome c-type biogenesis protein CcmH